MRVGEIGTRQIIMLIGLLAAAAIIFLFYQQTVAGEGLAAVVEQVSL